MPTPCRTLWLLTSLGVGLGFPIGATSWHQDPNRPAGDRGLPVSASAPSFLPLHLTGPHAGKSVCPLCVHGTAPQLQIWVQEANLQAGLRLARHAEELCDARQARETAAKPLVAYVMLVPTSDGKVADATLETVRATAFRHVFFVQVPSWSDTATSQLYGHSDRDRPMVRAYSIVNRRVHQRWDDPAPERWAEIEKALAGSASFVVSHDLADAEIAPRWEPGERMEVDFLVVDAKGKSIPGAKVSAMQADAEGLYNPRGWNRMTPRLSTIAWTNGDGRVTFRTIRPGPYPNEPEPAHVHFSVIIDGKQHFRTLWFEGDPRLTTERRQWAEQDPETVIVPVDQTVRPLRAQHTFAIR